MMTAFRSTLAGVALAAIAALPATSQVRLPMGGLGTYGLPGVIDMPTATVLPDGTLAVTAHAMPGSYRATLAFQGLPRVVVSFRYGGVDDPRYRARFNNFLHDRSFDLHWLVVREGEFMPAIAVGLRDFIGTGVYSSEYIVASRSFTPRLRVSVGAGWGRLATRDHPLRPTRTTGLGGRFEIDRFFRGPMAYFAGVEYQATDRLTLLAEWSSDGYLRETTPFVGAGRTVEPRFRQRTPLNLGFRYQAGRATTLSGYVMHGSAIGFSATFALNPRDPSHRGVRVTAPPPVRLRPAAPVGGEFSTSWVENVPAAAPQIREALSTALATEGVRLEGVELEARRVVLRVTNQRHDVLPRAIGRTARIMTRALPDSVEEIVVIPMSGGIAASAVTLRRSDLERYENDPDGADRLLRAARVQDAVGFPGVGRTWQALPQGRQRFEWGIGPYVATSYFDPTTPLRADFGLQANLRYNFAENLSANLTLTQRIAGNISSGTPGRNTITDPRFVPRVRTGAMLYSSDRPTVARLTLDYTLRPARNVYGRVTVGWLERMYAGVSTEVLWSSPESRLALGFELNHVAQRDPRSLLGVNNLRLTTGHVSAYYDIGAGFHAQLDVGRYLAQDVGATLRVERVFGSGLRVGAYATLTNMPFSQFGEGSFDKGITLTIPVTALLGRPSTTMVNSTIQSLNRDGGARLHVPGRLYPTIQETRATALRRGWGAVLQ